MDFFQALVLSLVQGVTEFLPISSSAHLVITSHIMGWQDQGFVFDLGLHVGTLAAVIVFFWRTLSVYTIVCVRFFCNSIGFGLPVKANDAMYKREILLLLVASMPAAIIGMFFASIIDMHLRTLVVVILANTLFAIVLWFADSYSRTSSRNTVLIADVSFFHALLIGMAQALAIIPGTSRSGVTLSCALLLGIRRDMAAKFSFLLAIPVIGGGGALTLFNVVQTASKPQPLVLVFAMLVAFCMALICIGVLMRFIDRFSLTIFVWYRLALSCFLLYFV